MYKAFTDLYTLSVCDAVRLITDTNDPSGSIKIDMQPFHPYHHTK